MRLSDLDPATVGRAATDAVLARLGRLALPLSPGVALVVPRAQGDTDLGLTVASLCAWAQSGALGDWEDHEYAADDGPVDDDPVALVLAAAWSRLRLMRGSSVTMRELGRLASLTPSGVKRIVAAGELAAGGRGGPQPHRVEAAEARRWLGSRGLRGW